MLGHVGAESHHSIIPSLQYSTTCAHGARMTQPATRIRQRRVASDRWTEMPNSQRTNDERVTNAQCPNRRLVRPHVSACSASAFELRISCVIGISLFVILGRRIGEFAVEGGLKSLPQRRPDLVYLADRRCSASVQRQPRPVGRGVGWKGRKFRFGQRFRIGGIRPSQLFSSLWHDSCTTGGILAAASLNLSEGRSRGQSTDIYGEDQVDSFRYIFLVPSS